MLNYKNFVDRQIAFYDDYEERQIKRLLADMSDYGCDLFLDVGANIGFYTAIVARSGAARHVIAFEPDERNVLQLGANLLLNRLVGKVTVIAKAVTSRSGPLNFELSADTSTGQSRVTSSSGSQVEGIALDDVVKVKDEKIFIKMDVEGHEVEVVRGMRQLVKNNLVLLQIEAFPASVGPLTAALGEMGLVCKGNIEHDYRFSNF